jgi:hypothetical protein
MLRGAKMGAAGEICIDAREIEKKDIECKQWILIH